MERIAQRNSDDCVACVLAMVMGDPHTYESVHAEIGNYENSEGGKHNVWWPDYLAEKGFTVECHKLSDLPNHRGKRGILGMTMSATGDGHVAAIDENGMIIDPSNNFPQPLDCS